MSCCDQRKIASINAKCSDLCNIEFPNGNTKQGYVPYEINIGGGDYVSFSYCMNCGKMVGSFPVDIPENANIEDEDEE